MLGLTKRGIFVASQAEVTADPYLGRLLEGKEIGNLLISPLSYKDYNKGLLLIARQQVGLALEEQPALEILSRRLTAALLNQEAYQYLHRINDLLTRRNIELQEEVSKSKTALSYTSHDLKTPLNAILGYVSLLRQGATDEQKIKSMVDRIQANARDLLQMINQVLSTFQYTKGEQLEVGLEPLIREQIQNQLVPLLFGKEVEVESRLEKDTKVFVSDPDLIKHLLSNLFSNAAKFTSTGTIRIEAKYTKDQERNGVKIIVSDTGVGIEPDQLSHIFEPFHHKTGYEGKGLGLSIVQDIVKQLGGHIAVKSQRGIGSEFSVWIPAELKK